MCESSPAPNGKRRDAAAPFLTASARRQSGRRHGLAEATVYVATAGPERAPKSVCFDYQQLSVGQAKAC